MIIFTTTAAILAFVVGYFMRARKPSESITPGEAIAQIASEFIGHLKPSQPEVNPEGES